MMNEHEEKTIAKFIMKEKRHRYSYLLDNPKKRRVGVNRLNHCRDLDELYIQWLPRNADIAELLKKEGCPSDVYVISDGDEIDGKTLPLEEAMYLVAEYGWGTIISCIPGRLAYYYDELGERRALLKRNP